MLVLNGALTVRRHAVERRHKVPHFVEVPADLVEASLNGGQAGRYDGRVRVGNMGTGSQGVVHGEPFL